MMMMPERLKDFAVFDSVSFKSIRIAHRDHPVGQITISWDLHGSEDCDVNMATETIDIG